MKQVETRLAADRTLPPMNIITFGWREDGNINSNRTHQSSRGEGKLGVYAMKFLINERVCLLISGKMFSPSYLLEFGSINKFPLGQRHFIN